MNNDILNQKLLLNIKPKFARKSASIKAIKCRDAIELGLIGEDRVLISLEAEKGQKIDLDAWICQASTGERWPQSDKAIRGKYNESLRDIDSWTTFLIKNDVEAEIVYETDSLPDEFKIFSLWGNYESDSLFSQNGKRGDFILNKSSDPNDFWIVRRDLFLATYEFI